MKYYKITIKLIQDDSGIAEEINNLIKEAASILDVNENSYIINPDSINISDPIETAVLCKHFTH